jgi:hypothetical protein
MDKEGGRGGAPRRRCRQEDGPRRVVRGRCVGVCCLSHRRTLGAHRSRAEMPVALQGRQQNRQRRPQALPAYPIGCLPEHNQRSPYRLVIQRRSEAGLSLFGDWLRVQRPDRRLVMIAGRGNELIEDLALLSAGRSAVLVQVGNLTRFRLCGPDRIPASDGFTTNRYKAEASTRRRAATQPVVSAGCGHHELDRVFP